MELPENDPKWERQLLEKIALASLNEQRTKRRWSVFFKLATLAYLIAVLILVVDWGGSEKLVDGSKHTALINVRGAIEASGETSAGKINDALQSAFEDKRTAVPPAAKRAEAQVRKPAADPDAAKAQRDTEAHQRAQQQNSRAQAQATEQATRAAANADRAAQSRVKHEQALQAAEERRARVEKSRADALAQGRKPAAPLPAPAASTPVR